MATVAMPHLGESVGEGTIGRWLKRPGEQVELDEPLVEVTTDKVNTEMPSPIAGVLQAITAQEGETVKVGAPIAVIAAAVEAVATPTVPVSNQEGGEGAGPAHPVVTPVEETPTLAATGTTGADGAWTAPTGIAPITSLVDETGERRRFTPVVLRLAEQHGIGPEALARLTGSGLGGRVSKNDLLHHIEARGLTPIAASGSGVAALAAPRPVLTLPPSVAPPRPAQIIAPASSAQAAGDGTGDFVPLTPMRRAIAEHMVRSVATAPHAWMMVEIDMTGLVRYRAAKKDAFQRREGFSLSYVPFFTQAVVGALQELPYVNASFGAGGIQLRRAINVGVAVALPDGAGLVVPVIKGADGHNLVGLARAVQDVATRARVGKLTTDDLSGGTFTVNNTGAFGSVLSQPIINQPQAAIITMEAIVKRPVVVTDPATGSDLVAVRSLMNCCLSFDHRVIDGLLAGQFLASVKRRLEGFAGSAEL